MKRLLFVTSMLALSGAAFAQTTYKTSPNGLLTTEGQRAAYIFGEWKEARMMFFDGEMRNTVMVMKEIAARHDYRSYFNGNTIRNNGQGRTWTTVTLDISFCDINNINHTFSLNPIAAPSRVFANSVTFPTMSGYPSSKPATWDLRFPFSTVFVNNGSRDICLDFDFNGGALHNGRSWSTSFYQTYWTDSFNTGDHAGGLFTKFGTGCTDSGFTNPGSGVVFADVYTNAHSNPAYQGKYKITTRSSYTPKGKPVVHVVSLFSNKTGVTFPGVSCEKVFIDLTQPSFLFSILAGTGTFANGYINFPLIPHQKSLEGVPLNMQAAWVDSITGALKFTDAEETLLPPMPRPYLRKMIYQHDPNKKGGAAQLDTFTNKVINDDATYNPIFRYAQ